MKFNGSVYVRGEVGDGAVICAEKDILVDGFVEGAVLEAGGDIILRRGNNAAASGHYYENYVVMELVFLQRLSSYIFSSAIFIRSGTR